MTWSFATPAPPDLVVAIDGPSGTGKSTVARSVARRLGARYLDTGALYRLVTVHVLTAGIDPADADAVAASLPGLVLDPPTDPDAQVHLLDGVDVTARIREPGIDAVVSAVAANPAVRTFLLGIQRSIAAAGPAVVEGRDIGTVVVPGARVKIFLTADPDVRAARRAAQNAAAARPDTAGATGASRAGEVAADRRAIAAELARRDRADSTRPVAPLDIAADAAVIDSTDLTVEQTISAVLRRIAAGLAS